MTTLGIPVTGASTVRPSGAVCLVAGLLGIAGRMLLFAVLGLALLKVRRAVTTVQG